MLNKVCISDWTVTLALCVIWLICNWCTWRWRWCDDGAFPNPTPSPQSLSPTPSQPHVDARIYRTRDLMHSPAGFPHCTNVNPQESHQPQARAGLYFVLMSVLQTPLYLRSSWCYVNLVFLLYFLMTRDLVTWQKSTNSCAHVILMLLIKTYIHTRSDSHFVNAISSKRSPQ